MFIPEKQSCPKFSQLVANRLIFIRTNHIYTFNSANRRKTKPSAEITKKINYVIFLEMWSVLSAFFCNLLGMANFSYLFTADATFVPWRVRKHYYLCPFLAVGGLVLKRPSH